MKPESQTIVAMMDGYKKSFILAAAVKLKLFDIIYSEGFVYYDTIDYSIECGINNRSMKRLLRALESMGLVRFIGNQVELTHLGNLLVYDNELRDYLLVSSYDWLPAWNDLYHAIRYGKLSDGSSWERRAQNPKIDLAFHNLMAASQPPFPNFPINITSGKVIDVGGGLGYTLSSILNNHSNLNGVLFEQPNVIKLAAGQYLEHLITAGRVELVAGSFLDKVPVGGNLYILNSILHDWDDDYANKIIKNCYSSMSIGSKLVVTETFLPEHSSNEYAAMTDIHLMVVHGGRKRTRTEYLSMLTVAGFGIESKYIDSIEARK